MKLPNKRMTNSTYDKWDPPSPITIFCRINNLTWRKFNYHISRGVISSELDLIRDRINDRFYCCGTCRHYMIFDSECTLMKRRVREDAICKKFDPSKELRYSVISKCLECLKKRFGKREKSLEKLVRFLMNVARSQKLQRPSLREARIAARIYLRKYAFIQAE